MNGTIHGFLLGAALVLLAGCDEEKYALRFSHDLHVTENGMDCTDCHGEIADGFKPLSHETCADCHDETASEEIGADTCGICHAEKQIPMLKDWQAEPAEPPRNIFMHTEALAGKCQDCHTAIMDKEMESVPQLQRADVIGIRDAAHASGQDCLTCHVDMDRAQRPANHDMAWTKRHGMFGMQHDAACSVCHSEDSCTECHSVMQPANHNNLFRMRTHGTVAAWNRASCMVCHEQDSCASCHAENRPKSHNARWGAPGFKPTHCIGCHNTSTAGDGCVTCHEGGNDVMLHEQYWGNASFNHSILTTESCYICHWSKTP